MPGAPEAGPRLAVHRQPGWFAQRDPSGRRPWPLPAPQAPAVAGARRRLPGDALGHPRRQAGDPHRHRLAPLPPVRQDLQRAGLLARLLLPVRARVRAVRGRRAVRQALVRLRLPTDRLPRGRVPPHRAPDRGPAGCAAQTRCRGPDTTEGPAPGRQAPRLPRHRLRRRALVPRLLHAGPRDPPGGHLRPRST